VNNQLVFYLTGLSHWNTAERYIWFRSPPEITAFNSSAAYKLKIPVHLLLPLNSLQDIVLLADPVSPLVCLQLAFSSLLSLFRSLLSLQELQYIIVLLCIDQITTWLRLVFTVQPI